MLHAFLLVLPAFLQVAEPFSRTDALTEAIFAHEAGDFLRARELYEHAILLGAIEPTPLYRAATCCAAQGDSSGALSYLVAAAGAGFRNADDLEHNPAFTVLHGEERWQAVVATVERAQQAYEASIRLPDLRLELLERARRDQELREHALEALPMASACPDPVGGGGHDPQGETEVVILSVDASGDASGDALDPNCPAAALLGVDSENTRRMREIVAAHGFPGRSLVGDDGATAAWLLVQHADHDVAFQRRCLELMRALPNGEVSSADVAYLTDRVAVNGGEPQVYGTQFHSVDGRMQPRPTIEPEKLDERRNSVGLSSMRVYRAHMENHPGQQPAATNEER